MQQRHSTTTTGVKWDKLEEVVARQLLFAKRIKYSPVITIIPQVRDGNGTEVGQYDGESKWDKSFRNRRRWEVEMINDTLTVIIYFPPMTL